MEQNFVFNPPAGAPKPYTEGKTTITIPQLHLLTPHWHPNANEITTCRQGEGEVTLIYPNPGNPGDPGQAITQTFSVRAGQVIVLPRGYFHYFVNVGSGDFIIDLTFDVEDFDILSFNEVAHLMPPNIRVTALNADPNNPILPYEPMEIEAEPPKE